PVYDGDTPQRLIAQILQEEPMPPRRHVPAIPRDLETVLLKCLAKDPRDRYVSAQDLADDLRRFAGGEPVKARRPNLRERSVRWARKNRKQVFILAATALLSMGLAVGGAIAVIKHLENERQHAQKKIDATYGHISFRNEGPPLVMDIWN